MKTYLYVALSFCSQWLCTPIAILAQDSGSWKERFLTEAPRKWTEYMEQGKHLQGSWLQTSIDHAEGRKVTYRTRLEFKQHRNCALMLEQNLLGKSQVGTVKSVNSQYGFQLRRSAPDKPWAVVGQDLNLEDGFQLGYHPSVAVRNWVSHPLHITTGATSYLRDLLQDPDFSVLNATTVIRDGITLVRIEFSARPKEWNTKSYPKLPGWMPLRGGWIVFDPARYWVIRECQVQLQLLPKSDKSPVSMEGKFTYKEGKQEFPIMTRIVRKWEGTLQGKRIQSETTEEYDLVVRAEVPEREFTFSAFGLSEPPGVEWTKPTPWYIWAAAAGVLCLVLGAGFAWLRRRAGQRASP